jgi:hypothetical protein
MTSSQENSRQITLKAAVCTAVGAVVLYHVLTLSYIFLQFTKAASGPLGATLVVTDAVGEKFPFHFSIVQKMAALPITNLAAKRYYEDHREFFLQAASEFELHPYWSTYNEATENMTFREVTTERIRAMYRQLQESGRMDYRLEKDRCAQFDFLRRNGIPHPKIQKEWYSRDQLVKDIESGAAVKMMKNWPVFFKACHLTQRSSVGTFAISSPEAFEKDKPELIEWINNKWEYRSRDIDRPWQKEGDALTDQLTPSFLLQEPMTESGDKSEEGFKIDGRISIGLAELKVEVIWGRVYIMQMDAVSIFLRNGEIEDYSTFLGAVLHSPVKASKRTTWIRDEGYLDCIIETAERVANAAHIEYIRVDVFIDKGDPKGCKVNEISLSTGYVYYGHEGYMAKLWAGPLHSKSYKRFNSTLPVYELLTESGGAE